VQDAGAGQFETISLQTVPSCQEQQTEKKRDRARCHSDEDEDKNSQ